MLSIEHFNEGVEVLAFPFLQNIGAYHAHFTIVSQIRSRDRFAEIDLRIEWTLNVDATDFAIPFPIQSKVNDILGKIEIGVEVEKVVQQFV